MKAYFQNRCARLCRALAATAVCVLSACANLPSAATDLGIEGKPAISTSSQAPELPREFRGAWVATVANIDWPSKKGLSAEEQQAEIVAMVARAKQIGLNALLVQVRPGADAIYPSALEPWSEFLSGEQGKPPAWRDNRVSQPPFDPLKTWIDEAHAAGIELHAWLNPYRALHTSAKSPIASSHISKTDPQVVKSYGGFLWLDPGEAVAAQRTLDVVMDIVKRYNIDGIHIDDYFYPYPVTQVQKSTSGSGTQSVKIDFPDEPSWKAYQTAGGSLQRADWRRSNVNGLIERIQNGIHQHKPWLRFGISPFGLGKPSTRPEGIKGFSQFDELYADVELWLQNGWLDYLVPQLYWPIDQKAQAFPVLLDYWATQNTAKRSVWAGLYTSQINDTPKSWKPEEVINQIKLTRASSAGNPLLSGHVHFSMVALMQNRQGIADQLRAAYATPALPPAATAATPNSLVAPKLTKNPNGDVTATSGQGQIIWQYAVWSLVAGDWQLSLTPATGALTRLNVHPGASALQVSGLGQAAVETERASIDLTLRPTAKPP